MFEVVELGKPGWFSRALKLRALCEMEDTKKFSDDTGMYKKISIYRAKFETGETVVIKVSKNSPLQPGDRLGLNALLAKSYLDPHLTYVGPASSTPPVT